MGDMADAIIDGECCQHCGEWFDDDQEGGYPRSCKDCEPDFKTRKTTKKYSRLAAAKAALKDYDVTFLNDYHWRIGDYDLWPTTDKFTNRTNKKMYHGLKNLLQFLEQDKLPKQEQEVSEGVLLLRNILVVLQDIQEKINHGKHVPL